MKQGQIVWFEIPVTDFNRAVDFYTKVLLINIKIIKLLDQELGLLEKQDGSIGGVLVRKDDHKQGSGCTLFFYVTDISQTLIQVQENSGTVVTPKNLLRQRNEWGKVVIAENLIDQNVGYFAEILDCEGNKIALYSHS